MQSCRPVVTILYFTHHAEIFPNKLHGLFRALLFLILWICWRPRNFVRKWIYFGNNNSVGKDVSRTPRLSGKIVAVSSLVGFKHSSARPPYASEAKADLWCGMFSITILIYLRSKWGKYLLLLFSNWRKGLIEQVFHLRLIPWMETRCI